MRAGRFAGIIFLLAIWVAMPGARQAAPRADAVDGEVLITFSASAPESRRDAAVSRIGGTRIKRFNALNVDHVRLPRGRRAADAIAELLDDPDVQAAQPNYRRTASLPAPPNDFFWVNDAAWNFWGIPKIQANQVWSTYTTGSSAVVIADIDTGVRYTHPDLAGNMWINTAEIPNNSVDDDVNGYVDDVHGINALTHSGDPMDDNGHGTHTAGTFAAIGNNGPSAASGTALVGVTWNSRILACKFLDATGNGTDAGAIECFNYITLMKSRGVNIRVSNNSWGGYRDTQAPFPQALKDAIDAAGNAGIINIFAAGNDGVNIDTVRHDPASFDSPSIISVAASNASDGRPSFSNYGINDVDLAAPGVDILSAWIGADLGCVSSGANNACAYKYLNGTSMATPHVAGVAALLLAQSPTLPVAAIKTLLIQNVTPIASWAPRVASGGRLNAFNAANALNANAPPSVTITSPLNGSSFDAPATVPIAANATDTGSIASVEFFVNGNSVGIDTTSPYTSTAFALPAGPYSLTAVAIDSFGAQAVSPAVSISVSGAAAPSATLTPGSLTFPSQLVGTTSTQTRVATLTNSGPGALILTAFNGAPPAAAFTVTGGDFQGETDCPLTPAGLPPAASCTFTFRFSPTASGLRVASFNVATNAMSSPHSVTLNGTAFVVDEPTVTQAVINGGARLQQLQNTDGGWYWLAFDTECGRGSGVSCPNLIGVTGLGLLSAFDRSENPATLADAVAAGQLLQSIHAAAPNAQPFSQDLEFLVALSTATQDPQYASLASTWFGTITTAHPTATLRADWAFARRNLQGLRTLAVWDIASTIRMAKAAGNLSYASGLVGEVIAREGSWKDVDPLHRWDQCGGSGGCGPADNKRAYDHTLLGMGSMIWAMHDLPGFASKIDEYRAWLVSQQDGSGSWDVGDLQITAYAALGLGAVVGTEAAVQAAVGFLIASQQPNFGWPSWIDETGMGFEFTNVDSEVIRAIGMMFSTQSGQSVQVAPAQLATVTFSTVAAPGATTVVARPMITSARVPNGYTLAGLSYDVDTTAGVGGSVQMCVLTHWSSPAAAFEQLRILQVDQPGNGRAKYVDRTILKGALAPNASTKRLCAELPAVGPIAIAVRERGK